nr:MAG TPA: hypothetical protein [Caudoviricetes sp.]
MVTVGGRLKIGAKRRKRRLRPSENKKTAFFRHVGKTCKRNGGFLR